jgi:hypothetical protein
VQLQGYALQVVRLFYFPSLIGANMPKKYTRRDLGESINVRLPSPVLDRLRTVAVNLNLEQSEIARRCVVEGLKKFVGVKLPGAQVDCADEVAV